jgi:nitrogen fixation protein FixH
MKKEYYISLLVICFVLIISGCGKKEEIKSSPFLNKIKVTLTDQDSSKIKHLHTYQLTLVNSNGALVDVDNVKLNLKMKSMNHNVDGKMKKLRKGLYEVKLELPMEGAWIKEVTLQKGKNERKINIR